jgi:hypothetical protein
MEMLLGGNSFFSTDSLRSGEDPIVDLCLSLSHYKNSLNERLQLFWP